MTVKEELIRQLEQLSESELVKVLKFVQSHVIQSEAHSESQTDALDSDVAWQAYLASEREREEVYRRLANS